MFLNPLTSLQNPGGPTPAGCGMGWQLRSLPEPPCDRPDPGLTFISPKCSGFCTSCAWITLTPVSLPVVITPLTVTVATTELDEDQLKFPLPPWAWGGKASPVSPPALPCHPSLSLTPLLTRVGIASPRGDTRHQPTSGWLCPHPLLSPPCLLLVLVFHGPLMDTHVYAHTPDSGPRTQGHLPSSGCSRKTPATES